MNASPKSSRARWRPAVLAFFWLTVLIYAGALAVTALRYEGRFSPDSVMYVDAARNLIAGNGLTSSLIPLPMAFRRDVAPPTPMTTWGPLYPLLIALLGQSGMPLTAAALAIPLVFFAVTLLGAFLALRRLGDTPTAMLGVALLIQFSPLRTVSISAWSETTALAFLMFFFWLIADHKAKSRRMALAGIAAGFSFAARYAMLPLFIVGAVACIRKDKRQCAASLLSFSAGFLLIAGPVLARNYVRSGAPLGTHFPRTDFGYVQVVRSLLRVCAEGSQPLAPFAGLVFSMLLIAALWTAYLQLRKGTKLRHILSEFLSRRRGYLLILWAVIYAVLLVRSEVSYAIDPISERLLLPASIVLVMAMAGVIAQVIGSKTWITCLAAVLMVICALPAEVSMARMLLRSKAAPVYAFDPTRSPLHQWISGNVTWEDLLIAEDGFSLPLYMGPVNTLSFETRLLNAKPLRYEELIAYLEKHPKDRGRVYLAVRTAPRSQDRGSFLTDLDAGRTEPYPWISKEVELEDAHVFRVEPAVSRSIPPPL